MCVPVLQFANCCFQHGLATFMLLFVATDLPYLVDMQAAQALRYLVGREVVIVLDRQAGTVLTSAIARVRQTLATRRIH